MTGNPAAFIRRRDLTDVEWSLQQQVNDVLQTTSRTLRVGNVYDEPSLSSNALDASLDVLAWVTQHPLLARLLGITHSSDASFLCLRILRLEATEMFPFLRQWTFRCTRQPDSDLVDFERLPLVRDMLRELLVQIPKLADMLGECIKCVDVVRAVLLPFLIDDLLLPDAHASVPRQSFNVTYG